jgi:hypothetical protein
MRSGEDSHADWHAKMEQLLQDKLLFERQLVYDLLQKADVSKVSR